MTKKKLGPRFVPDRDSKYMGMVIMYAGLSKDPHTQMGAMIVSDNNVPLGWGYNGPPSAFDDGVLDWNRPEKYDFIKHAEVNAIKVATTNGISLEDSILYVTGLPCKQCMLDIVDEKISRVCYLDRYFDYGSMQSNADDIAKIHEIASKGKVKLEKFTGNVNWVGDWVMYLKGYGVLCH